MKALRKDFYRQVKNTINRFVSLLLIVALGVAFYTGIRSSESDMRISADMVYDECNLMDIWIVSELGVTKDDVQAVSDVQGVEYAEGAYSSDVVAGCNEKEITARFISYSSKMNLPRIVAGKVMQNDNQCIIDQNYAEGYGLEIGDSVTVDNDDIIGTEYYITGFFTRADYLTGNKGSSSVGTGNIDALIILNEDQFDMDCYTSIYVMVQGAKASESYSDEYDELIDNVSQKIEDEIADVRAQIRYDEVVGEPLKELESAQDSLNKKKETYEKSVKKLEKAEKKLEKQNKKIKKAETQILEKEPELVKAESQYREGYEKYNAAKDEYEKGKAEYESGYKKYTKALKQYNKGVAEYNKGEKKLKASEKEYNEGVASYEKARSDYDTMVQVWGADALSSVKVELDQNKQILDQTEHKIRAAKKTLKKNKAKLDSAKTELKKTKKKLNTAKKKLDRAKIQLDRTYLQLLNAKSEIDQGYTELNDAKQQVSEGKAKLADAKAELLKSKKKLNKAETKINKAQKKIDKNLKKLKDIEEGEWYVLDRESIQSYVEYDQDAERIGKIGTVFPVIFFIVAAMVSLTTMTRMVEEERVQIGTMKALGYSKVHIAGKYLAYGALATASGGIVGGVIGSKTIPYVIITAYKILYKNLYTLALPLNSFYYVTAVASAFISVVGATILACYSVLRAQPAELMRPSAPKAGKRVLLEKIPFLWKHFSFNRKSTFRNLFRYKKRLFMTLFGISGCMALLLVGFGLKNSINSILVIQFDEIFHYDATITYDEDYVKDHGTEKTRHLFELNDKITGYMEINQSMRDVGAGNKTLSAYIIVPDSAEESSDFIDMRSRIKDEHYSLNDDGVIITEKLAKELGVSVGDEIYIKESETEKLSVEVSAIMENYCYHYLYMTKNTYERLYGSQCKMNTALLTMKDKHGEDDLLAEELLKDESVTGVSFIGTTYHKFEQMIEGLNSIVYVLVISAGALAFIVLYNLNNINIAERRRELATLKVLGFYDVEVAMYIYRENIIITVIGICLGMIFGYFLHQYIIQTSEINMVMFGREIGIAGYILGIIVTIIFAMLINMTMYFKLKKVDMATSLKTGE